MSREPSPSSTKRAQVSTIDFITGLIIITTAIILAVNLITSIREPGDFESVKRAAISASDTLVGTGYPEDWNETNVVRAGITTNGTLDEQKIAAADGLTYPDLLTALDGAPNIYWYFENGSGIINISGCGHGDDQIMTDPVTCEPSLPEEGNIVKMDRFVAYNDRIIRMVVIAWD